MSNTDIEIVVDDPTAPEADSPAVTSNRVVDVVVSLLLFALALTLGYDNWRTGAGWEFDRSAGRLFSVLSLGHPRQRQPLRTDRRVPLAQGSFRGLRDAGAASPRDGGVRADAAVLPRHAVPRTLCRELPADRRLQRLVGKIALWKSLLTAFVFTAVMFVTFDIAFDVIMPKGPLEAALGR